MTIDELTEATTFIFPRVLLHTEVESLFGYLQAQLGCHVNYVIELKKRVGDFFDNDPEKPAEVREGQLYGGIAVPLTREGLYTLDFRCVYVNETLIDPVTQEIRVSGFRVGTIPGYSLGDHGKEYLEALGKLRSKVNDYFSRAPTL